MARISLRNIEEAETEIKAAYAAEEKKSGYVTNMKRTLLHALPAYEALMQWYPLREEVAKFLSPKEILVFCHAISTENDCLICSTYFRRDFVALGLSPDTYELTEKEQLLEQLGRGISNHKSGVPDAIYSAVSKHYTEEQMVLLTAFGAIMVATNIINNVLEVPIDDNLSEYRSK